MDPLNPPLSIQPPPAPTAPNYSRVERIDRDGQQEDTPDWKRDADEESTEDQQEQFEDDYDPDWSDPAEAEPYGPDGALHDATVAVEAGPEPERQWDPRVDPERREVPRDRDDDGRDPEQHIDISA